PRESAEYALIENFAADAARVVDCVGTVQEGAMRPLLVGNMFFIADTCSDDTYVFDLSCAPPRRARVPATFKLGDSSVVFRGAGGRLTIMTWRYDDIVEYDAETLAQTCSMCIAAARGSTCLDEPPKLAISADATVVALRR